MYEVDKVRDKENHVCFLQRGFLMKKIIMSLGSKAILRHTDKCAIIQVTETAGRI